MDIAGNIRDFKDFEQLPQDLRIEILTQCAEQINELLAQTRGEPGPEELQEEAITVAKGMISRGGGFVHILGHAIQAADITNLRRIRRTWPDYWSQYLTIGRTLQPEEKQA